MARVVAREARVEDVVDVPRLAVRQVARVGYRDLLLLLLEEHRGAYHTLALARGLRPEADAGNDGGGGRGEHFLMRRSR